MSLRGSVSVQAEESSRETQLSGQLGADRVTDAWKITTGGSFDYSREDFDLDEDEPLRAARDEREFDWLVVKSVNGHWSIGTIGQIDSSSFENLDWTFYASPAVEFNVRIDLQHHREPTLRAVIHAPTAPGLPSSITNEARVFAGASGRLT
jgi:hypothetical protein